MAVNEEYVRLNHFKRSEYHWVVEAPEKSVVKEKPFAYDISPFVISKGEVIDYEAINSSITMIILSLRGDHIFRPWLGSSIQATPFELMKRASIDMKERLKEEVEKIEKRINVLNVSVEASEDSHVLEVNLKYIVIGSGTLGEYSQKLAM